MMRRCFLLWEGLSNTGGGCCMRGVAKWYGPRQRGNGSAIQAAARLVVVVVLAHTT